MSFERHWDAVTAADNATVLLSHPSKQGPVTLIGRYEILEKIGEGRFGVVRVAEQREPVKRRVALKIIKLGTPQIHASMLSLAKRRIYYSTSLLRP